jgi:hypothetical protein
VKVDGKCHMSKTLLHFLVVGPRLSGISLRSYIILVHTVFWKQVIHHLIKEREVCDMVKSDTDGSLIKARHVHQQKKRNNLVYGTEPRHKTYIQSNIIHFRGAGTVLTAKLLLFSTFATRNTCLQATCLIMGA